MKSREASRCPSCGAAAEGRFCSTCGAEVGPKTCPRCQATLPAGGAFCSRCGARVEGAGARSTAGQSGHDRTPWVVAAVAVVIALAAVLFLLQRPAGGPAASPVASGVGVPPDISNMSARDRFNALFDRVMRAVEGGDTATVVSFGPMALLAYDQLPSVDADARYHAALIRLYGGDSAGAGLLADSILAERPSHLFGIVIQGAIAESQGDRAGQDRAYARYREVYAQEIATGRQEYLDHQIILDRFRDESGLPR